MNDPVNFAVIGCGMLARAQHIRNIAGSERMVLHTCCDLSDEALAICRDAFGARNVSKDFHATIEDDDVHAIVLATTETLRLPVIAAAARAGKPIYVEKPLAPTLAEAHEIERVVTGSGIPFCVGHNRRSGPAMPEAHEIFRKHMTDPARCPRRFDREGHGCRPQPPDDGAAAMSVRSNAECL